MYLLLLFFPWHLSLYPRFFFFFFKFLLAIYLLLKNAFHFWEKMKDFCHHSVLAFTSWGLPFTSLSHSVWKWFLIVDFIIKSSSGLQLSYSRMSLQNFKFTIYLSPEDHFFHPFSSPCCDWVLVYFLLPKIKKLLHSGKFSDQDSIF